MLLEAGLFLIALAIFISVMWFFFNRSTVSRSVENGKSRIIVVANKDYASIIVLADVENQELKFVRNNVKKGEKVVFDYPFSQKEARVILEDGKEGKETIILR